MILQKMRFLIVFLLVALYSSQAAIKCPVHRRSWCSYLGSPVCGISRRSRQTYTSWCLACGDPLVREYIPGGPCRSTNPSNSQPNTPSPSTGFTYCSSTNLNCSKDYKTVCGVQTIGEIKTYSNACEACNYANILGYVLGSCQSVLKKLCNNQNRIDCSAYGMESQPSCHFYPNNSFIEKMVSVCCTDDTQTQIWPGKCPTVPPQNSTGPILGEALLVMCKSSPCSSEPRQVCGRRFDGQVANYSSGCQACSDSNTTSYFYGSCPPSNRSQPYVYCLVVHPPKPKICPVNQIPVCALPYVGIPFDGNLVGCGICTNPKVNAYANGTCKTIVKECPTQRRDCTKLKAPWIQSCGFRKGEPPTNVPNNLCCIGTSYTHVMVGNCPAMPP